MQLLSFFKLEVLLTAFVIGTFYGVAKDQITVFTPADQSLEQTVLADNSPQCPRINVAQAPL
ncbi:MAG: hypothetical protein HC799_07560 [Limnothrix sp. RL_2_0]|nr:hypothetical protein [Limnothrix sp. RL_2_0]